MDNFQEALRLLGGLVAFDTTSRNSNLDLIRYAEAHLAAHGIGCALRHDASGQKAVLHAVIGPQVDGGVALSAHVDCVPVDGQAWRADPFTLRREAGRLIGRGTCDMKGFAACMLAMAPIFAKAGLQRPVHLCLSFDEETSFAGAPILLQQMAAAPKPAACIVGEPSLLTPIIAHKGYHSWDVRVTGVSGHSSRATETANALQAAAEGIAWIAAKAREFAAHGRRVEGFDPAYTTVHAGFLHAGSVLNIVPDEAIFAFEVRSVPGDEAAPVKDALVRQFDEVIMPPLRAVSADCNAYFSVRAAAPPLGLPERHALVGFTQALSGRNGFGRVAYGTEAGFFEGDGIASIVCGPGDIAQAHQPEEWIAESEIAACLVMMERLAESLAHGHGP